MKTFKMLSLELLKDEQLISYPLTDGIIINQENSHKSWILEMYMDRQYASDFAPYLGTDTILNVRAVISYPDNEPASFRAVVQDIVEMSEENHVSVLLKGTLNSIRRQYAEQLLLELVEEGFTGDALLEKFKEDMRTRPSLKNAVNQNHSI
ncbi:YwpF family protein [Rummeliibacillus pycnus]|uniref:YwpF family protein n=1 Tax=Rummeliibacillus pycnus TaxID=101070 RepID=UPI000C998525|nr:YwpF family protein [Rummeliibacillus pycnus]